MPRIAPITAKSDLPAEHHAAADAVVKVFGSIPGPFTMLLHSPVLAERLISLVNFFRDGCVVEAKLRAVGGRTDGHHELFRIRGGDRQRVRG